MTGPGGTVIPEPSARRSARRQRSQRASISSGAMFVSKHLSSAISATRSVEVGAEVALRERAAQHRARASRSSAAATGRGSGMCAARDERVGERDVGHRIAARARSASR